MARGFYGAWLLRRVAFMARGFYGAWLLWRAAFMARGFYGAQLLWRVAFTARGRASRQPRARLQNFTMQKPIFAFGDFLWMVKTSPRQTKKRVKISAKSRIINQC